MTEIIKTYLASIKFETWVDLFRSYNYQIISVKLNGFMWENISVNFATITYNNINMRA